MKHPLLARGFQAFTQATDQRIGWHRLPRPLGIVLFMGIRDKLRRCNLFDAGPVPDIPPQAEPPAPARYVRTIDGTYNDLTDTNMGKVGCRFGRNVPLTDTVPEKDADLLQPSPREVSRRLLTREEFLPATTVNTLAAAWLQFEVHDWFSHGKNPTADPWLVPLENDDDWWRDPGRIEPMPIQRTRRDESNDPGRDVAPTYRTTETHWWDASQVYGNNQTMAEALRTGSEGRLRLDANGLPPGGLIDAVDRADTGGAFWVGLGLFHFLFMAEHNVICEELVKEHPDKRDNDEWLYQHARLINSALMAKIHATEWTPALIGHKTSRWGTKIEWYGLAGKWITDHLGRMGTNEMWRGIPGSPTDHHGTPYSLSEEFVAVYRMHQLIPDYYEFRSAANDAILHDDGKPLSFPELGLDHVLPRLNEFGMANSLYSFGTSHPGAVTLHNFPEFLQRFERPLAPEDEAAGHERIVDLAAVDMLRNRERGVPRYNRFRERFHMRPARSFEDLTDNARWAKEMQEVYEGDIDRVDLSVGLYAEPFPKGFAFSDTAFRVFILMATRRLKSDRFFTVDYRPEIYTPVGMRWVEKETLASVLVRHYQELEPALEGVDNAFKPWRRSH
jgi:hypothetical protein